MQATRSVSRYARDFIDKRVCEHVEFLVLQQNDVLKVDIGVQVKGRILDSAFTLNFEPTYDNLIEAVRAATDTGVRVRNYSSFLS